MNLVLIGYRGTGKSTIGKLLADELDLLYVCLDEEIIGLAGQSIPEIVKVHSWDHFRDLEEQIVKDCSSRDGQVLDTGGGVITRRQNISRLRKNGVVFLLTASIDDILNRIGTDQGRPSLTGSKSFTDEVTEVLHEREPVYQEAADFVIDTSCFSAKEAAEQITRQFRLSTS